MNLLQPYLTPYVQFLQRALFTNATPTNHIYIRRDFQLPYKWEGNTLKKLFDQSQADTHTRTNARTHAHTES